MKPIEHMPTMTALDLTPSFANSDMALPLLLQAVALFLQEDIGEHRQGPEAHNGDRAHHLILIQAQFFLAITKEYLDVPTGSDMHEQGFWMGFQITGGPIACLRERGIQRLTHNDHLAAVEFAHPRGHHMHIHVAIAFGPLELDIVTGREVSRIVREALPGPSFRCGGVFHSQPAIALKSACDQEPALPRRSPETFGAVPRVKQHMGYCPSDWLKRPDDPLHPVDLA